MSKQTDWELRFQNIDKEINFLKELITLKEKEKSVVKKLHNSEKTESEISLPKPRFQTSNVSTLTTEESEQTSVKRGRGRPKGSKNKPKIHDQDTVVEQQAQPTADLDQLPSMLEQIGQNSSRPIKLDDFVRILRKEGMEYNQKDFSKIVRNQLLNLVKVGKFIQNDDDERSYEYVKTEMDF